jgi:hypothetical protein
MTLIRPSTELPRDGAQGLNLSWEIGVPEKDEAVPRLESILELEKRENELLRQDLRQYRQNALTLAASVVLILSAVLQVPLPAAYNTLPPGFISDVFSTALTREGYQSIYFFRSAWQILIILTAILSVFAFYLSLRIYFIEPSYRRLVKHGLMATNLLNFDHQAILEASLDLFRKENEELYKQWMNTSPLVTIARKVVLGYVTSVLVLATLWGILGT